MTVEYINPPFLHAPVDQMYSHISTAQGGRTIRIGGQVPVDARDPGIRRYRFAYLASFTQSFVQVIDLDNAVPNPATYERIVYTLGRPTNPKGS